MKIEEMERLATALTAEVMHNRKVVNWSTSDVAAWVRMYKSVLAEFIEQNKLEFVDDRKDT